MNKNSEKIIALLQKVNYKKTIKIGLFTALLLGGVGTGAGVGLHYYKENQEAKAKEAQTTVINNQAKKENIDLKSEEDIKNSVSELIGISTENITFKEVYLTTKNELSRGKHDGRKKHKGKNDFSITTNENKEVKTSDAQQNNNSNTDSTGSENAGTNNDVNVVNKDDNKYIYKVKAKANNLDYKLYIDAKTGESLSVEVDD